MAAESTGNGVIRVLDARQNNLKGLDAEIPLNSLTVITGVSGSGKSSLAFDTLYAEGQRRYVESLSAYARQFLERIGKPRVGEISGLSPAIAIRQKNTSRNPRSTVGTVTEIYDYLRLLYSRAGTIVCRECGRPVQKNTVDEVCERLLALKRGTRTRITFPFRGSLLDLNSDNQERPVSLELLVENLLKQGFHRLLPKGPQGPVLHLPGRGPETLEELDQCHVLVDRLVIGPGARERLADSIELCYVEGNGVVEVWVSAKAGKLEQLRFTERFECEHCGIPYRSPEPRLFSFNNPYGACPTCHGFGNVVTIDPDLVIPDGSLSLREGAIEPFTKPRYQRFQKKLLEDAGSLGIPLDEPWDELPRKVRRRVWEGEGKYPGVKGLFSHLERKKYKMHVRIFISRYRGYTACTECDGERLCREARDVHVGGKRITEITRLPISDIVEFFSRLDLDASRRKVASEVLREIEQRLNFLTRVGLEYLTLDRLTSTLSGGEMQRIHLAASLSSSLVGTLYILDEPSIGLHARDEKRLIEILKNLRDLGNTVVVVEHEKQMIEAADHILDLGPLAGERGGELLCCGDLDSLLKSDDSLTARYLNGVQRIATPVFRRSPNGNFLRILGARQHNLKGLEVSLPLGVLVCVTGVSGSGKSTLVQDVLYAGLKKARGEWKHTVGDFDGFEGGEKLTDVVMVDQTPIGKTPRSNPVTYVKAFDEIRTIFAGLRDAHSRNLTPSHFSFNVPKGRCQACRGSGTVTVEMQFLADVELVCEECRGARYSNRILQIACQGKNIAEVLDLTVTEAMAFFKSHRTLVRKLKVLDEVGLGYLRLGQSATTLSGGEAQRIKLASYLTRKTSRRSLFIFDEPTTGLHFDDISKLLKAFDRLIARGATVVVIEHNLDVIKCADWIIDLGPEGGEEGGRLVAEGPPEEVARIRDSHTGRFLREYLGGRA